MRKLLFAGVILAAAAALAQRPWPPPGMACPGRTLVLYDLVAEKTPLIDQYYDEHVASLVALLKSAQVIAAGPTDDNRGVLIFNGTDWNGIEAVLKKEPFTREGIMKITSHVVWRACEAAK